MCLLANLRFIIIVSLCLFLMAGASGCAGLQERAGGAGPAASLVITPVSGPPATFITIRGSGFLPGEKIEVIMVIEGVPNELGEEPMVKEANEAGAFKTKSGVPVTAQPGVYTVKAVGDKGTLAVAPLEVEKKPEKKR